jgi:hypothetical protein
MGCIVAGGVMLSLGPRVRSGDLLGPVAIAAACMAWALDNHFTRKVSIHDSMLIACAKGLIAGPISVALAIHDGAPIPSLVRFIQTGLVGFMGTG